jgi:hypothetical protein
LFRGSKAKTGKAQMVGAIFDTGATHIMPKCVPPLHIVRPQPEHGTNRMEDKLRWFGPEKKHGMLKHAVPAK